MSGDPLPPEEWCAHPGCTNQRVNPHDHSLCPDHYPGDVDQDDRDEHGDDQDVDADDLGGLLADAMGSSGGFPDPDPTQSTPSTSSVGGTGPRLAMPEAALPLAQLDALNPDDRRRAARKRGLSWPTTDEARDRLFDTLATVIREEDDRVVDAPTALGKTYTTATTRWGARDDITGGAPVVQLLETRDARDEAIAAAEEHGGEFHVLKARHEACPVAAGDYDPPEDASAAEDLDHAPVSVDGEPASEWLRRMCDGRGIPFSAVHRRLEEIHDGEGGLPCCEDGECESVTQWDVFREGDPPLVIATHNFAHAPGLRMGTNVVIDEEPSFEADLNTDRVRRAVGAYLREIDAPVSTWEAFVTLATHDGYGSDAGNEREALKHALDREPERAWYFEHEDAHTMAPALARAIFHAEDRGNQRRVGKTPHEPPRLDANAADEDAWNREWVTVVLNDQNDVERIWSVPDFQLARSVVGLDAHPAMPVWQQQTVPYIQPKSVLDSEERRLWRRYERGLRVVQVGDATRPLASGEYFDYDGCGALAEQLHHEYGADFRTAITSKAAEEKLQRVLEGAGVVDAETMHFGEEKSRNDFAGERVGLVNGSIDPGDDLLLDYLAALDLDAEPERGGVCCRHCGDRDDVPDEPGDGCPECLGTGWTRDHGRGFEGEDAETAASILASVREAHVAQSAGRYARDADDPADHATVFVRTDAMPEKFADVQVPGVVWTYGKKQEAIVRELREAERPLSARTLAERVGCTREHVRQTLEELRHDDRVDDVQAFERAGDHGATLYATDGVPNSGVVDLGGAPTPSIGGNYTWGLAIRDADQLDEVDERGSVGIDSGSNEWQWRSAASSGGDRGSDDTS